MPNFQQTAFQNVFRSTWQRPFGPYPRWEVNFLGGSANDLAAEGITFTRASSAQDFNDPSLTYGTNVPVLTPSGLLLQGARTNYLLRSSNFATAPWAATVTGAATVTATANNVTAPDGTLTAAKLEFSAKGAGEFQIWRQLVSSIPLTSTVTPSVWLRADSAITVLVRQGDNASLQTINLTTSWQRFLITTGTIGGTSFNFDIQSDQTSNAAGAKTVYAWGGQLEVGSFASSYIPTTGATATRAADVATISNLASIGYNTAQGTFVAEWLLIGVSGNQWVYQISDGTANNRIYLSTASGLTSTLGVDGGAGQFSFSLNASPAASTVYKSATAFRANDFAAAQNGGSVLTDVSGTVPTVTTINLGNNQAGAAPLFGYLRRLTYYPTRLPDATLQALTA